MNNTTFISVLILFSDLIGKFKELYNEKQNYTEIYPLNANCSIEYDCNDLTMFCNLNVSRCQCAQFYALNEDSQKCEFQSLDFKKFLKNKTTTEKLMLSKHIGEVIQIDIPWIIVVTMIFGIALLALCTLYVCFERIMKNKSEKSYKKPHKMKTNILDPYHMEL